VASQVTTNREALIITDSTAANATNDTSSMTHGNPNLNQRKLMPHNLMMNAMQQDGYILSEDNGQKTMMKKIHTLGNSLGAHKKSLNISQ
jgi:hypothetical protein